MRLTSKGRYAVMALVDLAKFYGINPVSLRDISLRQGISLDYLEQIFSKLRKKEIVQSVRGTQGGYVLNKKAKDIKLTNIFEKGSLAMVKSGNRNSSSTEFFFVTNKFPELDGRYSIFGKVIKGIEILDKINKQDLIYEIIISN